MKRLSVSLKSASPAYARTSIGALATVMFISLAKVGARAQGQFPDVPKNHWAYDAVLQLRQKGIMIGYPNGTFNGTMSPRARTPPPAYDVSTPASTWLSLMRAMATGDESEMARILSNDCFTKLLPIYLGIDLQKADLSERQAAYRQLATQLSRRRFVIVPALTSKNRDDVLAVLDDGSNEPGFIGHGWEIEMKRAARSWQVTAIIHSGE